MPGKDTNIGAKRARETREALGIGPDAPLDCVLTVAEKGLGLPVVVAALPEGVAGACWRGGDRTLLWVNGGDAVVRQRFTLAHEVGHVHCRHDGRVPVETFTTLGGLDTDSREVQANAFAAELLAPRDGVRALAGSDPGPDEVVTIASAYGVSLLVAVYRLNTLGITRGNALVDAVKAGECSLPTPLDDGLAAVESLPRLSPVLDSGSLASIARGRVSAEAAAAGIGRDAGAVARGVAVIQI